MLLNTGANGKDIRIENNVLWQKTDLLCQYSVSALTDGNFTLYSIGLTFLVECHDNDSCTILAN